MTLPAWSHRSTVLGCLPFLLLSFACKTVNSAATLKDDGGPPAQPQPGPLRSFDTSAAVGSGQLADLLAAGLTAHAGPPVNAKVDGSQGITTLSGDDSDRGDITCTTAEGTAECTVTTRFWPNPPPELEPRLVAALANSGTPTGTGSAVAYGDKAHGGQLVCDPAATPECRFLGVAADYVNDYEKPSIPANRFPTSPAVVAAGAQDTDGTPLPASTTLFLTPLPSGSVNLATYVATSDDLAAFWALYSADAQNAFNTQWTKSLAAAVSQTSCRKEEIFALGDYAGAGYADLDSGLRKLAGGTAAGTPVSASVDLRARVTASGVRCLTGSSRKVVYRGARLNAAQLAKYKVGATVVERSFTSTASGGVPDNFVGNVEFHIFDAVGASLELVNPNPEEDETVINAGTLFNVTYDQTDDSGNTVIEMQQVR